MESVRRRGMLARMDDERVTRVIERAFEWNWAKRPADPEKRREIAGLLRESRAAIARTPGPERAAKRAALLRVYRERMADVIAEERALREAVEEIRGDYWLSKVPPSGGVQ